VLNPVATALCAPAVPVQPVTVATRWTRLFETARNIRDRGVMRGVSGRRCGDGGDSEGDGGDESSHGERSRSWIEPSAASGPVSIPRHDVVSAAPSGPACASGVLGDVFDRSGKHAATGMLLAAPPTHRVALDGSPVGAHDTSSAVVSGRNRRAPAAPGRAPYPPDIRSGTTRPGR
jgi:hypothetical protein